MIGMNTRSSCNITFGLRRCSVHSDHHSYRVCRTKSWFQNLLPYVLVETGRLNVTPTQDEIQTIVLNWLVRYKHKIVTVRVIEAEGGILSLEPYRARKNTTTLIEVLVRDLYATLDLDRSIEVDPYKVIREYSGPSILIQHSRQALRIPYVISRNRAYHSLKTFVENNTCVTSDKWSRQVVICEWFKRCGLSIRYEGGAKPIPLNTAVKLLDTALRRDSAKILLTPQDRLDPDVVEGNVAEVNCAEVPKEKEKKVSHTNRRRKAKTMIMQVRFNCQTRASCAQISELLSSGSHSKATILYTADNKRHFLGQPPKLKRLHGLMYLLNTKHAHGLSAVLIEKRIGMLRELEGVHSTLIHLDILSPRDQWEDWIDNFQHEHGCDRAFMCLLIIIMSSSTADTQLANIVPRLFSSGLTSAKAVIEVAQQYGLNTFCSLFSEGGRYYQNAERILNAADYFVQYHGGTIPESITVNELCTLFGVGYKTANIVVTTAFGRVDGIPSDIHVIRWSSMLGWCTSNVDGLKCSKLLEAWLPHSKWESINPVFGAFGQLLVSDKRDDLLQIAKQHPSSDIRALFRTASKVYQREKKID